jgi:phosphohistidine swiveling domain-containing protein
MEPVALFTFMKSAIEQREMGKFKFTRNLSDALSMLGTLGESVGISREQMSFADIAVIKEIHVGGGRIKEILERSIAVGQMRYEEGQRIVLPSLITKSSDPWSFRVLDDEPNFITKKRVISDVSMLGAPNDLRGKIVCIPSADPGFDWLFATGIAGLITEWGGVNSHMAIRSSELGLPSVIGAGSRNFLRWSKAECLDIDCGARLVTIIR